MLFNSHLFICLFLPAVLILFFQIGKRRGQKPATLWLIAASLAFYAYWKSAYLLLLIASVTFNYAVGTWMGRKFAGQAPQAKLLLGVSVAANLGLLVYYKYTDFFLASTNALWGTGFALPNIVLPLAISFFTFNQIAYLVDVYQGKVEEYDFFNYCLFIVFFPHLIAGPIVHHRDIIPQFNRFNFSFDSACVGLGLTIFSAGLFKKVVFADSIAVYATPVFAAAAKGVELTAAEAWLGALAYTLQLYFDFSGYSDMAVGLALLFGIRFPWNFDAPYKAASIIDFWRRWHITLSQFLRDYLYIPLGGNRKGPARRFVNLMLTMLLGGLWHGANWTFVVWGALHGFYIVLNHLWNDLQRRPGAGRSFLAPGIGAAVTFVAVVAGWVIFRSDSLAAAGTMFKSMAGLHAENAAAGLFPHLGFADPDWVPVSSVAGLLAVCWWTPSLKSLVERYEKDPPPAEGWSLRWRPSGGWAVCVGVIAWLALMLLARPSEFLYYQF
jgi:D-alanyl-lipoteichoic acid acyltransferase DltB (MBOAT superfamily)